MTDMLAGRLPSRPRPLQGRAPAPGGVLWFFGHDLRLAIRDRVRAGRGWRMALALLPLVAAMHLVGLWVAGALPDPTVGTPAERHFAAVLITFFLVSLFFMLAAQAVESVARAIFVRGDLDLILASPVPPRRLFAARMAATSVTTLWLGGFLVLPIADVLVFQRGWPWASAFGVLLSLAFAASALAVTVTYLLFRGFGARRTRLLAQVAAAVIGAVTVVGAQVPFILHFGSLSVAGHLSDPWVLSGLPGPGSLVWVPSRAVHGDWGVLAGLLAVSAGLLGAAVLATAPGFAEMATAAVGMETGQRRRRPSRVALRLPASPRSALRAKELRLILRDPWLLSQSLTQILYLLPPALLLWQSFGNAAGAGPLLVPVLVMATSQLAGGLAWLALSAEDAPDLVSTAPVGRGGALHAKVEAVLVAVGAVAAPLILLLALDDGRAALVAILFVALGVASNCFVQTVHRRPASRSAFRRRQHASRLATLCETIMSIGWAGAASLTVAGSPLAAFPAGVVLVLLAVLALFGWRRR
ncbi:permease [Mangrovibrevibacter kandeliae]|uniref:permease n=1 Tax=Mangrovibrevibacter kandeliae TaxID=2968473 RepID=UPI002117E118|nr:permease [Aurantimonas sp. CSK15Z-1]MCQ8780703.1 permease [Aurantimonas sp. CSK15Z-1]